MKTAGIHHFLLVAGFTLVSATQVYSASYNGSGPGTSIINATGSGDYTSLEAAFDAIETAPLTGGDWTFLIETDLMETSQLLVGQITNGNSITFKPASGVQPTISLLSNLSTTVGPSGHIIIGATTYDLDSGLVSTDNVIFDGSNNNTDSQDMTFITVPNGHESGLFSIIGDSDGVKIKNCIITLDSPRTVFQAGIRVQCVDDNTFSDATPDNTLIENCIFNSNTSSGIGIVINRGGGNNFGLGPNNTIIRNNQINSARYGILLQDHRSVEIVDNTITMSGVTSNGLVTGIRDNRNTISTAFYQMTIERNILNVTQSAVSSSPVEGIALTGGREPLSNNALYRIRNNSIFVEPSNSTALTASRVIGIRVAMPDADFEIQNNSINVILPNVLSVTSPELTTPLEFSNDTASNHYIVENNILRFEGSVGYAVSNNLSVGTIFSNDNNYFINGGTAFASVSGTDQTLLYDYKIASGLDSDSTDTDPLESIAGITGTWTSKSDLRFNGPPFMNFMGTPIPGITSDLNGVTRDLNTPTKGAFEISPYAEVPSIAGDSFLYH